jgi:hypothetical protein
VKKDTFQYLVLSKLEIIEDLLTHIINREEKMALDLTELEAAVARVEEVDLSAIALITGIVEKLDELATELEQAGIDATKVREYTDELKASSDALAAAVVANT